MALPAIIAGGAAAARGAASLGPLLPQVGRFAGQVRDAVGNRLGLPARAASQAAVTAEGIALRSGGERSEPPPGTPAAQQRREEQARPDPNLIDANIANGVFDRLLDDDRFLPNSLNAHWQVAYNWRLLCVNDRDIFEQAESVQRERAQNGEAAEGSAVGDIANLLGALDRLPQIVIAESGVTAGFNIKSVVIDGTVAPNYRTRNFIATTVTIELTEPLGTSFTDALAQAAREMGVRNFQRAHYLLELTFEGYGEDGRPDPNPTAEARFPNGGRWVWMVKFEEIDVNFTASGGSYVIKAIPMEQQIFSNERLMRLPEIRAISGATVGEFLDNMTTALNQGWVNRWGQDRRSGGKGIVHFEEVVIEPVDHRALSAGQGGNVRGWSLVPPDQSQQSERQTRMGGSQSLRTGIRRGADGVSAATFPMGTPFTDIIEEMFAATEHARDLGLDRGGNNQGQVNAGQNRVNEANFRESVVFRVEPHVRVRGYDTLSEQYMLDVRLFLRPYRTQVPILSPEEVEAARADEVQGRMLDALESRGFLKKRYEYLFTGRNTEVKSLDIRYNLKWAFDLPLGNGAQRRGTTSDAGTRTSQYTQPTELDRAAYPPELEGETLEGLRRRSTEAGRNTARLQGQIETTARELQAAERERDAATTEERRNRATERVRTLRERSQVEQGELAANSRVLGDVRARLEAIRPPSEVSSRVREAGRVFAEEFVRPGAERPEIVVSFDQQAGNPGRHTAGFGFLAPTHRDKSLFGAVLEQLYAPFEGFLVSIDLDIRGDPYWLGQGNLERQFEMFRGSRGSAAQPRPAVGGSRAAGRASLSQPEFVYGDICFLLVFRYPHTLDEEGAPQLREQDIFNGIYHPVEIKHSFVEGEFSQRLSCRRLPLLNVIKAFGFQGVRQNGAEGSGGGRPVEPGASPENTGAGASGGGSDRPVASGGREGGEAARGAVAAPARAAAFAAQGAAVEGGEVAAASANPNSDENRRGRAAALAAALEVDGARRDALRADEADRAARVRALSAEQGRLMAAARRSGSDIEGETARRDRIGQINAELRAVGEARRDANRELTGLTTRESLSESAIRVEVGGTAGGGLP